MPSRTSFMKTRIKTKNDWKKREWVKNRRIGNEQVTDSSISHNINNLMNKIEISLKNVPGLVEPSPFKESLIHPIQENINNTPELHNQAEERTQSRNDVTILERLRYCPECKDKNIFSSVERLQYEEDRYWVFCTRRDGCSFLEEFKGKAVVTKEDLIMYGLPGQLLQHMDIVYEDINKIVRLCMSEYIKVKHLASPATDYDLEAIKGSVRILAESHSLDGFSPPTEVAKASVSQTTVSEDLVDLIQPDKSDLRADGDLERTIADPYSLEFLIQHSQSTKPYECDLSAEEEMLIAGFPDFTGLSETSQKNPTNKSQTTADEDLVQLFQMLDSESLQATKINDGESTLLECQEKNTCNSKKIKKCPQPPKLYNPYDTMKKLADSLVADLPILYQEDIKAAFSKIEGYHFPQDFVNDTTLDKLPLFKILEERERQAQMKAEVDKQLKDFMAEMDGFNLLC